jgi:predicted Fe-Mo cluster-binding NifX family protein
MSRIAVCSSGEEASAPVDGRFGRCNYFVIYDEKSSGYGAVANSGPEAAHGAGTGAAQVLLTQGVNAVLTNRIGPKAFQVLKNAGIKVYAAEEGKSVKVSVDKYFKDELKEILSPNN